MPDLTGELMDMATDGASRARPLAVTEIIRRGNRRRARTIGQRSVGGLSLLGVGAAAIFATSATHGPAANPATSATSGVLTATATSSSAAGSMTVTARYRDKPHNKIELLSVSYSGHTRAAMKRAVIEITIGPSLPPLLGRPGKQSRLITDLATVLRLTGSHDFSGSLSPRLLGLTSKHGGFSSDEPLRIALSKARWVKKGWTVINPRTRVLNPVGLILTR